MFHNAKVGKKEGERGKKALNQKKNAPKPKKKQTFIEQVAR